MPKSQKLELVGLAEYLEEGGWTFSNMDEKIISASYGDPESSEYLIFTLSTDGFTAYLPGEKFPGQGPIEGNYAKVSKSILKQTGIEMPSIKTIEKAVDNHLSKVKSQYTKYLQ